MVKAKDLSIYDDDSSLEVQYVLQPEKDYLFQKGVLVARQQVWKIADSINGVIQSSKSAYNTIETSSKDVVAYIKTEDGFYPRAGAIALAGLTGIVLARKGGAFRKVLYSGILATTTASVCYPYQTVIIAEQQWNWIKLNSTELLQRKETNRESKSANEHAEMVQPIGEVSEIKVEQNQASSDESKMDYGQSNSADKDLYTTRS